MSGRGILGILDTDSKKEIKQKYSKIIKEAYASEDQELIMRIQKEYKAAIKGLKFIVIEDVEETEKEIETEKHDSKPIIDLFEKQDSQLPKEKTMKEKIEEVYWDRKNRFEMESWGELFSSVLLKEEEEFKSVLEELLKDKFILPLKIREYLYDKVSIKKDDRLKGKILECLDEEKLFDEISIEDIMLLEEYFKRREFILELYLKGYYSEALENIIKTSDEFGIAENILVMIKGICLYNLEKYEDAMEYFKELVLDKDTKSMAKAYYMMAYNESGSYMGVHEKIKKASNKEKLVFDKSEEWKRDFKRFFRRTSFLERFLLKRQWYRMFSLWRGLIFSVKALLVIRFLQFILTIIIVIAGYFLFNHTVEVIIFTIGLIACIVERKVVKNGKRKG